MSLFSFLTYSQLLQAAEILLAGNFLSSSSLRQHSQHWRPHSHQRSWLAELCACRAILGGATNVLCHAIRSGATKEICHATKSKCSTFWACAHNGVAEGICRANTTGATSLLCRAIVSPSPVGTAFLTWWRGRSLWSRHY